MAISAAAIVPQRMVLEDSDPSNESIVWILPVGDRQELERGQLLTKRRYSWDDQLGVVQLIDVNLPMLHLRELWYTYDHAEIELLVPKKKGEDTESIKPFKPKADMTLDTFLEAMELLPKGVKLEWRAKMLEVNPDWRFPY